MLVLVLMLFDDMIIIAAIIVTMVRWSLCWFCAVCHFEIATPIEIRAFHYKNQFHLTYLFAFLFVSFSLFIVGIFSPIAITVGIVCQKSVICFPRRFDVILYLFMKWFVSIVIFNLFRKLSKTHTHTRIHDICN